MNKIIVLTVSFSVLLFIAGNAHVRANDTSTELVAAIKSGDVAKVAVLLSNGTDPNARIEGGYLS